MPQRLFITLMTIILSIITGYLFVILRRVVFLQLQKDHRILQSKKLRFLQVQIPKNAVARSSDIDAKDHIQSMKQNIEVMNQVYKNFYAIFEEGWKNKRLGNNYISMEMIIEKEVIKYILWVPKDFLITMEKMIASFYSGAIVEQIDQPKFMESGKYFDGGEFVFTKHSVHPIKTYESFEADPMDSILSAFSSITKNEKAWIQILVEPLHEDWLKQMRKKADKIKEGKDKFSLLKILKKLWNSNQEDKVNKKEEEEKKHSFSQQQLWDFDKKMDDELFRVKIRTLATSPDPQRPKKIITDISRLFNQYNYIGLNTLKFNKAWDLRTFAKNYVSRYFISDDSIFWAIKNFKKNTILNIKELSSIIHFPHGRFNQNPRIARQRFKVVPAPDDIPNEGITVGFNNYWGVTKDIRITDKDRFRHIYILGQTGTGKTTIMLTQMIDDMENGRGFTFIDPHGDGVEFLLKHFPKERIDDLIHFDLGNTAYPIGLNPLEVDPEDADAKDVVTNDLVEMFIQMYGPEIFGPRIQDYFRNACLLLMDQEDGGTIVDIMRLFTDEAFAEAKIRNIKDPVVASWWNKTYKKMGDREKAEIIPFIQAKFWPFTTGVYVRNIIGQPKSAFNMYDAMQEKKIILLNLSKGISWEETSKLIGKIIAMQIKLSALKRAKIDEDNRVPHYLYVDEFQNYVSQSFESILSEARKYKLGLVVAHQYTDQLKQEGLWGNLDLSKTIFGNIGTMFVFKVGANDAEFLAKEFEPEFNQTDLTSTEAFMGACKISVNNQQTRPFSFKAKIPYGLPSKNSPEKVQIMKQISSLKWGTKRELVDKEIYFRVGV